MIKDFIENAKKIYKEDVACKSFEEAFLYPGIYAIFIYRIANYLYNKKLYFVARLLSEIAKFFTGIEIHPGAKLGKRIFIDHGRGVVIGETAVIGDDCILHHNVTLGAKGNEKTFKRHPTIGKNVIIGCNTSILGDIYIGDNSIIGAGAVVTKSVNENSKIIMYNTIL